MFIATYYADGARGRAPAFEESLVLKAMRSLDTIGQITEVPWYVSLNGIMYCVVWSESPGPNAAEDRFYKWYSSGRCKNCRRLWGDHPYGSKEFEEVEHPAVKQQWGLYTSKERQCIMPT